MPPGSEGYPPHQSSVPPGYAPPPQGYAPPPGAPYLSPYPPYGYGPPPPGYAPPPYYTPGPGPPQGSPIHHPHHQYGYPHQQYPPQMGSHRHSPPSAGHEQNIDVPEKGSGKRNGNDNGNGYDNINGTNNLPDSNDCTSSSPKDLNGKSSEQTDNNHEHPPTETADDDTGANDNGQDSPTKSPQARNTPVPQLMTSSSSNYRRSEAVGYRRSEVVDDMVSRVSAMRSDFHFYAEDNKQIAFDEIQSESILKDPVAIIAKLNEQLMTMWEGEPNNRRNEYMMKEEMDRTRFMNEDEIESRHCATLTSRPKPYMHMKLDKIMNGGVEEEPKEKKRQEVEETVEKGDDEEDLESPTKKLKDTESDEQEVDHVTQL